MSNIITRVPRIWQPQSPVDVDPSHPFAKGLKALRLSSTQQSFGPLFRGARGTAEKAITSAGVGEIGAPAGAPTFTTAQISSPFFYWAVYAILDGSVAGDSANPFSVTSSSGDTIHFETTHYATHALVWRDYAGPSISGSIVAGGWVIGGVYLSIFRSLSNTSHDLNTYRLGDATSISSGTSATDISAISYQDFGTPIFGGTTSGRRRPLLMGGLNSGTVTTAEVAAFVRHPWRLFAPITRRIWVPASAGGDISILCSVGNAVAAGTAATLSIAQTITCTIGNAVAAGTAATITTAQTVSCAVGNAAAAGVAATLTTDQTIAASVGNAVAAGVSATIDIGGVVSIDCTVGNATAAGIAAAIDATDAVIETARQAGAGKSRSKKRRYTVEVNGEEYSVESAEEALAVLNNAKEAAQEAADLALTRAVKATKRPLRKVLADARKTMEAPHIVAPPAFEFLVDDIARQIDEIYSRTINSIEIAARLAIQRRAEEEDDEDILLLL